MKLDPIIRLLALLLVFSVLCLFAAEFFFKDDSQMFQVVSGIATGILGALLGIITGKSRTETPTTPATVQPEVHPADQPRQ